MSACKMPRIVSDNDPPYRCCCGIPAKAGVLVCTILRLLDLFQVVFALVLSPGFFWFAFVRGCLMVFFMLGLLLDKYSFAKAFIVFAPFHYICTLFFPIFVLLLIFTGEFPGSQHSFHGIGYSDQNDHIIFAMAIQLITMVPYIFLEYRACWLYYTYLRDSKNGFAMHSVTDMPADDNRIHTYEDQIDKAAPFDPVEDHRSQAFQV